MGSKTSLNTCAKKYSHLHEAEPKELEADRADITGKEPVLVRDWNADDVIRAIRNPNGVQTDIIDAEMDYLLAQPAWNRPAPVAYGRVITRHDDLCGKFLSMCKLDAIPVYIHEEADA